MNSIKFSDILPETIRIIGRNVSNQSNLSVKWYWIEIKFKARCRGNVVFVCVNLGRWSDGTSIDNIVEFYPYKLPALHATDITLECIENFTYYQYLNILKEHLEKINEE